MSDGLDRVWEKFHKERVAPLVTRLPGMYRSLVVETNDPLQWYRVRFKCPELHDSNLKAEDCPWADKSPTLGGKNAGSWTHPCIGDIVWISFEKGHPYGPIWTGFATETRRKRYPLESVYTKSPLAVKEDETADETPQDYLKPYLPQDFRPMSHGWRDRYGSVEIDSSVGFNPIEHKQAPAAPGWDAVAMGSYDKGAKPVINEPDRKYCATITKYGMLKISSDVGYWWHKEDDTGEFLGDFDKDRPWEIKRTFYYTKLLNENKPNSADRDQRRIEYRTRAGHKFELRDVGWAQMAGGMVVNDDAGQCHSRQDEFDTPQTLSKWTESDERWIKIRTKGGHIIQAMDAGFHPEKDNFYKRLLMEEIGADIDDEKAANWTKRDARQIRIVTRWGVKFVLDDRGSDGKEAETKEKPRANGWLQKTRRSWTTEPSTPRGFAFEANDKDELDTSRWYSPKSKIVELNDREDYAIMCTDMSKEISPEWQKLKENEFALDIAMSLDPEKDTYHLKLDKHNGYLRLKTAAGGDNGRRPEPFDFPDADTGLNQGLEARDGRIGTDGPWTEIVDIEHRGIWLSKKQKLGIWRAKEGSDQFILIHDGNKSIVIRNAADGPVQIFCNQDVQIIANNNIALKANNNISLDAGKQILMKAGGAHASLQSGRWTMDVPDYAKSHMGLLPGAMPGPGAQQDAGGGCIVPQLTTITQSKIEPADRAKVDRQAEAVSEDVITGAS